MRTDTMSLFVKMKRFVTVIYANELFLLCDLVISYSVSHNIGLCILSYIQSPALDVWKTAFSPFKPDDCHEDRLFSSL